MVWNDLKFHLTHRCHCKTKNELIREVNRWCSAKLNDVAYCNSKFDYLYRVVDQVITMTGRVAFVAP